MTVAHCCSFTYHRFNSDDETQPKAHLSSSLSIYGIFGKETQGASSPSTQLVGGFLSSCMPVGHQYLETIPDQGGKNGSYSLLHSAADPLNTSSLWAACACSGCTSVCLSLARSGRYCILFSNLIQRSGSGVACPTTACIPSLAEAFLQVRSKSGPQEHTAEIRGNSRFPWKADTQHSMI